MKRVLNFASVVLLLLVLVSSVALANGGLERLRQVISAGGNHASAGILTLHGTLGQPISGSIASGNVVVIGQGFWAGGETTMFEVYLPIMLK